MSESKSQDSIVIERTFAAPVNVVWRLWTEAAKFQQWYGPNGATIPVANMDVQVGGKRLICMEMQTPNGPMKMWFAGEYLEIDTDKRLVYTESMADEHGNIIPPEMMGMPADSPKVTEIIVELEDLGDSTKMVMTHVGVPAGSPGEAGWKMAIDKMAALVA